MPRPKINHFYELHWADIESLSDWNDPPERLDCPVHVNYWWLVKKWDRRKITQVFATTYSTTERSLHDHQLIPTGAIVLLADMDGNILFRHDQYDGTPIAGHISLK